MNGDTEISISALFHKWKNSKKKLEIETIKNTINFRTESVSGIAVGDSHCVWESPPSSAQDLQRVSECSKSHFGIDFYACRRAFGVRVVKGVYINSVELK